MQLRSLKSYTSQTFYIINFDMNRVLRECIIKYSFSSNAIFSIPNCFFRNRQRFASCCCFSTDSTIDEGIHLQLSDGLIVDEGKIGREDDTWSNLRYKQYQSKRITSSVSVLSTAFKLLHFEPRFFITPYLSNWYAWELTQTTISDKKWWQFVAVRDCSDFTVFLFNGKSTLAVNVIRSPHKSSLTFYRSFFSVWLPLSIKKSISAFLRILCYTALVK